jgi:hypothetical protein
MALTPNVDGHVESIDEEKPVPKKVGLIAAAATAGMIALSPLAFATNSHDHPDTTDAPVEDTKCTFDQKADNGGPVPGVLTTQIQMFNCWSVGGNSSAEWVPPPAVP